MTSVVTFTYTHSVTYVADNILKSIKDIIRLSGLDPSRLVDSWASKMLALETWLKSKHLEKAVLEIYNPKDDSLIVKWDIEIAYGTTGDGSFWTDTDQLKYHIKKSGVAPQDARYDLILHTKPGRPDVAGWESCSARDTTNMVKQSLGTTVEHNGLGASASYWRKA